MEMAIRTEMHTYSGGLGVLAGDTARSCADLELPVVFVTLMSRQGYLRQEFDAFGWQMARPDPWDPMAFATPLRAKIAVPIVDARTKLRKRMSSRPAGIEIRERIVGITRPIRTIATPCLSNQS